MKKEELSKFFVYNNTKYTVQTRRKDDQKVIYVEQPTKLDDSVLTQHLQGLKTIGVYPVKDGKTKWFCIDIDIDKSIYEAEGFDRDVYIGKVNEIAEKLKSKFALNEIHFYREETGGKGTHLWCFFEEPVKVDIVLGVFLPIIKSVEYDKKEFNVEWFPTSENSKSVKLPGGKNIRYNIFSEMECPMSVVKTVPSSVIMNVSNPLEKVFTKCRAFASLKEKSDVQRQLRHHERFAIGSMCARLEKHHFDFVEDYFFKNTENYSHKETRRNLDDMAAKGIFPMRCSKLQELEICSAQCAEIGVRHKSPIGFYLDEIKERKVAAKDIVYIDPQANLLKGQNYFFYKGADNQHFVISNFTLEITEEERIYDDLEEKVDNATVRGKIKTHTGEEYDFEIKLEDFQNAALLEKRLYATMGLGKGLYISSKKMDLFQQCVNKFSNPVTVRKTYSFGFNNEKDVYYSPSVRIDRNSIQPNTELLVSLESATKGELEPYLDFALSNRENPEEYWKHYITEEVSSLYKHPYVVMAGMSHVFDLFLKHKYTPVDVTNSYILWYSGESGAGKSKLATIFFKMFGNFPKAYSFASTAGRLEYSGHFYKDAIYMIDDFKLSHFSDFQKTEILRVLQVYADKTGRSRLTRTSGAQKDHHIRGNMLVTGEDIVVQEASNIARIVRINITENDCVRDTEKFMDVHGKSTGINELTPYIIRWCMNVDAGEATELRKRYETQLASIFTGNVNNNNRVASNYSRVMAAGVYAIKYFYDSIGEDEMADLIEGYEQYVTELFKFQMNILEEENGASRFWNTLQELLAVGKLRIVAGSDIIDDSIRTPIVGFIKDAKIYILMQSASKYVKEHLQKTEPLKISDTQLASNLFNQGYFEHYPAQRVTFNGKLVKVFSVNTQKQAELIKNT